MDIIFAAIFEIFVEGSTPGGHPYTIIDSVGNHLVFIRVCPGGVFA